MPYADPSSSSSSTTTTSTFPRPHHRRTRSAFSDESGPGAFVSLGSLPRRRPSQGTSNKKAVFHLTVDDDSPPEGDAPSTYDNGRSVSGSMNSLRLSLESGRFSPSVSPPTRIELPKSSLAPQSVPFPTSSPLGTPTEYAEPSPFVPPSPPHTNSLPRTPSTSIILSNGKPLKSSLKSSSSSPNVAGDFDQRTRHMRAQSAPSTPRVHFAEKDSGLETVRVFNKTGKPASLSKPPGEETETETEAESSSYPFPSFMTPMSPAPSSSQMIHEVDTNAGVTSSIPNPNHNMWANVFLENITLPRTRPPTLRGTVLVRNVSFEKHVAVRFTLDDWQTTSEVTCKHVVSLPGLPPPFPRIRTVGDVAADIAQGNGEDSEAPAWDRFSFTIRLEDYESKLTERTLYLVARYVPNHGVGGEFWDNNDGANYRVGFRRAAPSPLTTSRPSLAVNTQLNPPKLVSPAKTLSPLVSLPFTTTLESPTSQQRSFSAPSTMRFTPSTSASVARAIPPSFREPESKDSDSEVPIEKEVNALNGIPPLARRHSAPSAPQFPMPPPISIPPKPPVTASDSHVTSPAQSYISRRLSLSNYVAPSASLATPPSTPPKEDKLLPKVGQQQTESKEGPVSPTFVLIGGMPASIPVLHPEPQAPKSPDQTPDDHCSDSPTLKDDTVPFSPTSRSASLSIMSSLEAQLGSLNEGQRKTHMPSPPVSREASEDGSGRSSPAENESSSKTGGRTSPKGRISPVGRTSPPRRGSPTRIDLSVLSPTESREGRVDTSDSSYAAFVRQWCFAQSSPPTPGVITASNGPSSASPAVTPSPPITGGLAGLGGMGTSGLATGMNSFMNGRGNHHSSTQPRRQQAWPVEHQIGVGSSTGYGFPGFSFAPTPVGSSHSGVGSMGMSAGMSEGIVGGEFSSVYDWVSPSARGIAV